MSQHMYAVATVTSKNQLTVPKPVREALGIWSEIVAANHEAWAGRMGA